MVFRAFLEQRRCRPGLGRAHLGSLMLHVAALLTLFFLTSGLRRDVPVAAIEPPRAMAVSLFRSPPRVGALTRPGATATGRKRPPRPRRLAASRERPAPLDPPVARASDPFESARGSGPEGALTVGLGGGGPGDGIGTVRGRRQELFARVIGGGIPVHAPTLGDRTFVSLKEATALRTDDYFPRLPAALWTDRGPYVVVIELCVSEEGRVSEAALLSRASAHLDPVVLAAVRGWRYRPRFEGGKPAPFCHGVVIKYERHYY